MSSLRRLYIDKYIFTRHLVIIGLCLIRYHPVDVRYSPILCHWQVTDVHFVRPHLTILFIRHIGVKSGLIQRNFLKTDRDVIQEKKPTGFRAGQRKTFLDSVSPLKRIARIVRADPAQRVGSELQADVAEIFCVEKRTPSVDLQAKADAFALGGFLGTGHIGPKPIPERAFDRAIVFIRIVIDIQFPSDAAVVGAFTSDAMKAVVKIRYAKQHLNSSQMYKS